MNGSKPAFHSVVDLGLRDVGVRNQPRRLAAYWVKGLVPFLVVGVVSACAMCGIAARSGAGPWIVFVLPVAWLAAVMALAVRIVNRSPVTVMKVTAEGTNQAVWPVMALHVLLLAFAALLASPLLIPLAVLTAIMTPLVMKRRGLVPEVLRRVRAHLAPDEPVAGDGVGLARGVRGRDALRVVVATDRRLLVAGLGRSQEGLVLVDVPYRRVERFGIEWKLRGRMGVLSLTLAGDDEAASETHVITSVAPANLVSIAQVLQAHGAQPDDPEAVAEAARGWEDARRRATSHPGEAQRPLGQRLLDREAMSTRDFDRGLWVLLGLSGVVFYANRFGIGLAAPADASLPMLFVFALVCAISGYLSGTSSSLVYSAPLNLLIAPAFFFVDASAVASGMLVLSAVAALGLWAGAALRRAAGSPVSAAAPARSRRRSAIGGLSLTRISSVLLAAMLGVVAITAIAGFELTSVRLAVEEATAKQLPVDGRSDLTGGAASLTYTPSDDLTELVRDEHFDGGPNDGARWEVRTSFTEGYNGISLAHYIFEPRLDDPAAVEDFVAEKDLEHSRLAGARVTHTERMVDGRKGYVWDHASRNGFWYYAAWFPQPVHTVRVECVARSQIDRFEDLCEEAMRSLRFRP